MAKKPEPKRKLVEPRLSSIALRLLDEMAKFPNRIEYRTRVLGVAFEDPEVALLDAAYAELISLGFAKKAGSTMSFFGTPKSLARITAAGQERVQEKAA